MRQILVVQRITALAISTFCIGVGVAGQTSGRNAWRRLSETPVLSPQGSGWGSAGTFNPAVVMKDGKFVMLYRAQDANGTSRLGYAESADGIRFTRREQPVLSPEAPYEKDGGVEDPRIVGIGATYYLTYTGYNKKDAQLCLATSPDLIHWKRVGVILPAYQGNWNKGWTKSGAILTTKIRGEYWMYWLGMAEDKTDQMGLSRSKDITNWTEVTQRPVLPRRPGKFDSRVVEPGPPPILTSAGIVLIYNGADDNLVYRTGIAVFDRNDPGKLLYRSDEPVFSPELQWEKVGQVPNVVFVEGLVQQNGGWLLYYGAADKYVGVMKTRTLLPPEIPSKSNR
jgi:predicted GH43/DUF377 family glycosyl hydrolase